MLDNHIFQCVVKSLIKEFKVFIITEVISFSKKNKSDILMFNTLSNNESIPKGKKVSAQSITNRQANFSYKEPNHNPQYETVSQYFYNPKQRIPNPSKMDTTNASQFDLAQSKSVSPTLHFLSETKRQFGAPQNPERAKQVRDKVDLLKTTYHVGDERAGYATTFTSEFYDKSAIRAPEMRLKQPERYNIISNKEMPGERIKNASNFDFWNPHKTQNRTSNNLTDQPMRGVKLDPITNRILPTSKPSTYY